MWAARRLRVRVSGGDCRPFVPTLASTCSLARDTTCIKTLYISVQHHSDSDFLEGDTAKKPPVTLPTTTPPESTFLCLYASVLRCLFSWERTGHLIWRAIYLEGSMLGGLFFVCVILSVSCLRVRGWINFLFATRWSTPFMEIIIHIPYSMLYVIYDLEGSNDVNLQSTEFDPCR